MARYKSHTHKVCECGSLMKKGWTLCESCRATASRKRYFEKPFQEWDKDTVLVIYGDDKYFTDEDDIMEYCEEQEVEGNSLMLMICTPNHMAQVQNDLWDDIMPEDGDGELPKEVQNALDYLNVAIEYSRPISWSEGKFRTTYEYTPESIANRNDERSVATEAQ